jgi:hypothetical protein
MTRATKEEDENWVGTPPEGFHTRDQADPDYWRSQYQKYAIGAGLLVVLVILVAAGAFIFG